MERLAGQIWSEQIVEKKVILLENWLLGRDVNFNTFHLHLLANFLPTWNPWMDSHELLCLPRFSV